MQKTHKYLVFDDIMELSAEVDTFNQMLDALTYFCGKDFYSDEDLTEREVYQIKHLKPQANVRVCGGRFVITALK